MAALEVRGERFRIVFRFQGKTWKKTLKAMSEKSAELLRASVEELLGLVDRGVVQVPEGVDILDFFASHAFRHSFISALAAKGVDQRIIDEIVGHQSEEQQRRYRHLLPSQKASALASVFG